MGKADLQIHMQILTYTAQERNEGMRLFRGAPLLLGEGRNPLGCKARIQMDGEELLR